MARADSEALKTLLLLRQLREIKGVKECSPASSIAPRGLHPFPQ